MHYIFRFSVYGPSTESVTSTRTPGNGRGGLILKKHLLSGQTPCKFVRIVPGLPNFFQNLSRPPYLAYFLLKNVRISWIRLKIAADSACSYDK